MSANSYRGAVSIVGLGYYPFSRNSGVSVLTLAVKACLDACADAGVPVEQVDGVAMYQRLGDSVGPAEVVTALGLRRVTYTVDWATGGNASSAIVMQAANAVHAGIADYVLVYRAMNGRSGFRMGGIHRATALMSAPGPQHFEMPYGLITPPEIFGLQARVYMERYGVKSEDLALVAVNNRLNACHNPRAIFQSPITVEDHQNSRLICEPYHLFDCCTESDGAVAMLLTSTERARDLKRRPVLVLSAVGGSGKISDLAATYATATKDQLLQAAGISLDAVDLFEPYDDFTDQPMRLLEDVGFCGRGEAKDFIREGHVALDGAIPMNCHGGLLSEGYVHGFNNVASALEQLRWEAEDLCPQWREGVHTFDRGRCRQVRDAHIAMTYAVLGSSALILQRG
jgi:acetyl-CoA acetyltransferase